MPEQTERLRNLGEAGSSCRAEPPPGLFLDPVSPLRPGGGPSHPSFGRGPRAAALVGARRDVVAPFVTRFPRDAAEPGCLLPPPLRPSPPASHLRVLQGPGRRAYPCTPSTTFS